MPGVEGEVAVLEAFRRSGALRHGHFELRSGLHSDWYFQCALLMQYPDRLEELCRKLAAKLGRVARDTGGPDVVVSPAIGGIILGYEMARALGCRAVFLEKEDGRLVLRRNFEICRGERALIAEDVVTRGGRVQQTIHEVKARGAEVTAIAVLVDRREGVELPYEVVSLLRARPRVWTPQECPLCRRGVPLEHPGSR